MKHILKILFVSVCILLLISASCSVAFASPSEYNTFAVQCQKPTVTENSGYIEILYENDYGHRFVSVFSWSFTPYFVGEAESYTFPYVIRNQFTIKPSELICNFRSEDKLYGYVCLQLYDEFSYDIGYGSVSPDNAFIGHFPSPSGYSIVGYHIYGNFTYVNDNSLPYNDTFFVTYAEDSVISSSLNTIVSLLLSLQESMGNQTSFNYSEVLSSILFNLQNLDSTASTFKQSFSIEMEKLLGLINDVLTDLDTLILNTDETNSWLASLDNQLMELKGFIIDVMYLLELDSNAKLWEIKDTLDAILQILQQKTDTEFTTVNQNEFDNYYDVENSLLHQDVNVSDVMKVEVNQNALTVIWDLVERGLQSHGKVFGMVLTILALGIVALILGR